MKHDVFDGEYWNTDENTTGVTRLRFEHRDDGIYVSAWGACFPEDCEWGETTFTPLESVSETDDTAQGFATWPCETGLTHCVLTLTDNLLTAVVVAIRSDMPSYRMSAEFRMNPIKSADAISFDPLMKFKRMWDGSEPGWKLIRYTDEVFLVEFHFDKSSPNDAELQAVIEFVDEFHNDSYERARDRLRECEGIGLAMPFTKLRMDQLEARRSEGNLRLTIEVIATDDYLTLTPSGLPFNWVPLRRFRRPVTERMLAAGVPIVSG